MDVKVFRTFLEVAKVRHFGRAAENLYITQAAVSARIKQLENFFETQLFVRDRNSIKLTSSGQRLIHYADIMVNTIEQAKTELALDSHKAIQLTLAGTPNLWDAQLQEYLNIITEAFQGYAFTAEIMSREQINRGLLERTLDFALAFDPLKSEELLSQHIADLELLLVSTETMSLEQAFEKSYVYVDWGTRFASEHAERHPHISPPLLRTSTGRIALDFILTKGGTAYLPSSIVEEYIYNDVLFRVKGAELWHRPIYFVYRRDSSALGAIQQIETLIRV